MSAKENKAILQRFLDEAYNKGNLGVGDEPLTANCVFHTAEADIEGIEGWKKFATGFLTAFPDDLDVTIEDIVAEGKIEEVWTLNDALGIMQQVGAIPSG